MNIRYLVGLGMLTLLGGSAHAALPNGRAMAAYAWGGQNHIITADVDGSINETWYTDSGTQGFQRLYSFAPGSIVSIGAYGTPDGVEHVDVALTDGTLREIYWRPAQSFDVQVISQSFFAPGSIVAIDGYATPDGTNHIVVGLDDAAVYDVNWLPAQGIHYLYLGSVGSSIVDVAGYAFGGNDHVIVGDASGQVHELWYSNLGTQGQQVLFTYPAFSILSLGAYGTSDGVEHVDTVLSDRTLREIWWVPAQGLHEQHITTTEFGNSALQATGSFYSPVDGKNHIAVGVAPNPYLFDVHWAAGTGITIQFVR
jgi:hypothetical protein